MFKIKKIAENLFYIFLFLVPWQAMLIIRSGIINGEKWQYGTIIFFGTEIILWLFFLLGFYISVKEKDRQPFFQYKKFYYAVLFCLAVWSAISVFGSGDGWLALYSWIRLIEGIIILYMIIRLDISLLKSCWVFLSAGLVQSVLAIFQFLTQSISGNKWLGLAQHYGSDLGSVVIEYNDLIDWYRWLRAYGSFTHPNILGGFLTLSLLAGIFLFLHYKNSWWKVFSLIGSASVCAGLFFSFSKSAWLAFILALLGWLIVTRFRNKDLWKITLYLLAVFLILFLTYRPLVIARFSVAGRLEVKSAQERIDYFSEAAGVVRDNFWTGVGIGNYTNYIHSRHPDRDAWDYQPVHNIYLLVWSELGLIGFVLLLFCWFFPLFNCLSRLSYNFSFWGLLTLVIIGLFDHYLLTGYVGLILFWILLAFCLNSSKIGENKTP